MILYDRADIYDLRFDQRGWDLFREHYRVLFDGTGVKSVLDCSIGSGNLTLELAELGYRVTGSDLSGAFRRAGGSRWSCSSRTSGRSTGPPRGPTTA